MKPKHIFQFPDLQKGGILIMDSGIGALSFVSCLNKELPQVPIVAFADQEYFPYGEKAESEIVSRLLDKAREFVELCEPATILIACNTASTIVLPELRSQFSIPIVGIVPAIKPAALISKTGKIALLATSATVSRKYTDDLIKEFAGECEVIKIGSSKLATLAEEKVLTGSIDFSEVKEELKELELHPEIDCLILGCTHFTFIEEEIRQCLSFEPKLIDPVIPVSKQVLRVSNFKSNQNAKNYLLVSSRGEAYSYIDKFDYGIDHIIYL